jgi:hypothetical protein
VYVGEYIWQLSSQNLDYTSHPFIYLSLKLIFTICFEIMKWILSLFLTGSHYVAQVGLEHTILLPLGCWDYRCATRPAMGLIKYLSLSQNVLRLISTGDPGGLLQKEFSACISLVLADQRCRGGEDILSYSAHAVCSEHSPWVMWKL